MHRISPKTETVVRCVARQDGGFLIIAKSGVTAVASYELREGSRFTVASGKAVPA